MDAILQAHVTFHLSGWRAAAPESGDAAQLQPALFGKYHDLAQLRHDFPLVLCRDGGVRSLSGIVDALLQVTAVDDDGDRLSRQVLRLEQRIRRLVAAGARGSLSELWAAAAADGGDGGARPAPEYDGQLVDCGRDTAAAVLSHLWGTAQREKAVRFRRELDRLIHGLSELLRAETAASAAGFSAERLRASLGPLDQATFDFGAMSRMLQPAAPAALLSDARRERIAWALGTLQEQRFAPAIGDSYDFAFASAAAALEAYWARQSAASDLLRAIEVARLEIDGACDDTVHHLVSGHVDRHGPDPALATMLPNYFVELAADGIDHAEHTALFEILSAGLPIKVLIRTDDILDASALGPRRFGFGFLGRQLATTAMAMTDAFVLQTPVSHLLKQRAALGRGFDYTGTAIVHVFSGTGGQPTAPPYLVAAAALESRAFPIFVFDPSAGDDWAARCSLDGNPQAGADWPVHPFAYETAARQTAWIDLPFTFVEFVLCDRRYDGHFAAAGRLGAVDHLISVTQALDAAPADRPWNRVPSIHAVDARHHLQSLVVDELLIEQAVRCRDLWRSLQELGGVNNSHARRAMETRPVAPAPAPPPVESPDIAPDKVEPAAERSAGDPYIETPRCSTCNECIQINSRMFGYNDNRQASIIDPSAGTFRQLVEAAESCQVSIIHPGTPRDPNEPGLDELVVRAEAFL